MRDVDLREALRREIDVHNVSIQPAGFFPAPSSEFVFYHVAYSCAGPRLVLSYDNFTSPMIVSTGNVGYYGGTPGTQLTVASEETFLDGEDVSQPSGHCGAPTDLPVPAYFGPVKTIDINSLGLVPPLHRAAPISGNQAPAPATTRPAPARR